MKNPFRVRMTNDPRAGGFTLIELLTVIAIIAILAAMTAVAVPMYLAKARETKTISNLDNVAKSLMEYSARTGNTTGYPPAYGYVRSEARELDPVADLPGALASENMHTEPYTYVIGIHGADNVYEELAYASTFDSDRDKVLNLFEYQPIGLENAATGVVAFSDDVYMMPNASPISGGTFNEVQQQMSGEHARPYVYVPFNTRQLAVAKRYWLDRPEASRDKYGEEWDAADPTLEGRMFFPPPQYDGFVLIGSGPGGNTGGLASAAPPGTPGTDYPEAHKYHILGLRIAFLATRDLDPDGEEGPEQADGQLDFEYQARKQGGGQIFLLPDGTNGQGAFIKVIQ